MSIRRKMRATKAFLAHFEQSHLDLRARTKSLEGEAQCLMEMKCTSLNQFVQMPRQAKIMTEDMKRMDRDISTVKSRFDEKTAVEDKEHGKMFKELNEQKKGKLHEYQERIGELRDELKSTIRWRR